MKNGKEVTLPEGYMQDAKGRLVPTDQVDEYDKLRDELVHDLLVRARELRSLIETFKTDALDEVETFVELSAERYDVKLGGKKGNVQLTTFDGKYKLEVSVQDRLVVDERIYAAKAIVHECLKLWAEGANANLKVLVEHAFQVDKAGKLSISRLLALTRQPIEDERWQEGMRAIRESINPVDTSTYVRFYERDERGKYRHLSLDIAAV